MSNNMMKPVHEDWNYNWSELNIRGYAEKAAQNSDSTKPPKENTVKRYEFLLREYLAQIKESGLSGAIERVVKKYEFLGISTGVVYAATRVWREENHVPVKHRERNAEGLRERVARLEEQVAALVLLMGEDKVQYMTSGDTELLENEQ